RQGRERRVRRPRLPGRRTRRSPCGAARALRGARKDRRLCDADRRAAARAGLSGGARCMNAQVSAVRSAWWSDGSVLLVGPAVVFLLLFFVYPFAYGFWLSLSPNEGDWLANY